MTVSCCVPNCTNVSMKKNNIISYHTFPTDNIVKKSWMKFCKLPNNIDVTSKKKYRICSDHFKEENYELDIMAEILKIKPKRNLIYGSIPTILIKKDLESKKSNILKKLTTDVKNPKLLIRKISSNHSSNPAVISSTDNPSSKENVVTSRTDFNFEVKEEKLDKFTGFKEEIYEYKIIELEQQREEIPLKTFSNEFTDSGNHETQENIVSEKHSNLDEKNLLENNQNDFILGC